MMLDLVMDGPKLINGDNEIFAFVLAAIIIVCAVIITIKLINKKKEEE